MKTIAVLIHSFTIEYSLDILNGISKYFENKDVKLIVSQVKIPHSTSGLYEYQCWAASKYLLSQEIDGVIVITGSFSTTITSEALSEALKDYKDIPVISISGELTLPNSYSANIDISTTYSDIISHLKNKHGCKKIGFLSANPTKSNSALSRYEAYKQGLADNGFEYDDNLVLHGDFTKHSAYNTFVTHFTSREQIPFDAILCANDLMAVGCTKALKEFGMELPKDCKIIGFDETTHAIKNSPRLSTVDQGMFEQGFLGAELMWEKLNGKEIPKASLLPVTPIYRQSCGCISLDNTEDVFMNAEGELCTKNETLKNRVVSNGEYFNFLSEIDNIYTLFDLVKAQNTLQQFYFDFPYLMDIAELDAAAVFFTDEPIHLEREDDFVIPEKLNLSIFIDKTQEISDFEPGISFNPSETLQLQKLFGDKPGNFIINPIFSGKNQYGLIIVKLCTTAYAVYNVFLKIISNAITQAYEYTQSLLENKKLLNQNEELSQDNSNLAQLSTTDELTKVLNRRGFMEIGQRSIDMAIDMKAEGLVFFADMDGLKKINDTYGHKMGDRAIKVMASVLTKVLRANDVVGRLSGDEFAAVTVGMNITQEQQVRDKIAKLFQIETQSKKFPFQLSCSIGAVEFTSAHKNLRTLLTTADQRLYMEKRRKHQNRQ